MKKIAVANPEHAPYGRAAREALARAGIWEKVAGKVVYGENVGQALQFVQTGTDAEGKVRGHFQATGIVPRCIDRIRVTGVEVPNSLFERGRRMEVGTR